MRDASNSTPSLDIVWGLGHCNQGDFEFDCGCDSLISIALSRRRGVLVIVGGLFMNFLFVTKKSQTRRLL
jgi:hypothetical protein